MPDLGIGRQTFTDAATQMPYQEDMLEVTYHLRSGLVAVPVAADTSKGKVTTPFARVHAEYMLKILKFSFIRINALPTLPSTDRANPLATLLDAKVVHNKPGRTIEGYPIYQVQGVYVWLMNQPVFDTDQAGYPGVESPVMVNSPTANALTPDLFTTSMLGPQQS